MDDEKRIPARLKFLDHMIVAIHDPVHLRMPRVGDESDPFHPYVLGGLMPNITLKKEMM
jgi:hypothetical protein